MRQIHHEGFTVIELLVVIAIVGVLVAVIFVALDPSERLREARNATQDIQSFEEATE